MLARSSPYDAIGHVVSGLLILGACEAAHDGRWLIGRDWPPGRVSMYLTLAYSIGQIVAFLSRAVIEQLFVRNCLPAPEDVLLAGSTTSSPTWRQRLFPAYFQPLDVVKKERVWLAAGRDGLPGSARAIFDHAATLVENDEVAIRKAVRSWQFAGLWRNLCLGLLIVAAILVSGMLWHSVSASWGKSDWRKLGYCTLALWESASMFYRYLKCRRRHAVDVLTGYAIAREQSP